LFNHKKNPRKTRWTKAFRKSHGKELTLDPAFEFEKKRDAPPKYSRELWQQTQAALKRIEGIKTRRQAHYAFERFQKTNEIELERDRNIVRKNMPMLKAPHARPDFNPLDRIRKKPRVIVKEGDEEDLEEEDLDEMTVESSDEEMAVEVN